MFKILTNKTNKHFKKQGDDAAKAVVHNEMCYGVHAYVFKTTSNSSISVFPFCEEIAWTFDSFAVFVVYIFYFLIFCLYCMSLSSII